MVFARCASSHTTSTTTGRTGRNWSARRTSEDRKHHATHACRNSFLRWCPRRVRAGSSRTCGALPHPPMAGSSIARSYMQITSGPYVPPKFLCQCRVPVWIGIHSYWHGWGQTVCQRCRGFGFWGVIWARLYPNMPRAQILRLESNSGE